MQKKIKLFNLVMENGQDLKQVFASKKDLRTNL